MLYSVGVPWTDCRILRGCVGVPWADCRILRGCVIQCGCALDRLQDFEGLCYSVWVCLRQTAGF